MAEESTKNAEITVKVYTLLTNSNILLQHFKAIYEKGEIALSDNEVENIKIWIDGFNDLQGQLEVLNLKKSNVTLH